MDKLVFATKNKVTAAQQRTARAVRPKEFAPTGGHPGTYQADIIFYAELGRVNHGYKSILTAISVNSRYAYAEPLKRKNEAAEAMGRIIKNASRREPMRTLWTDSGTEFTSAAFQRLIKNHDINHHLAAPKNHSPLARVDRFHLTLRSMLEKWFLSTGRNNWVDDLPAIIDAYNSHTHRTIGKAPAKVSKADIQSIRSDDMARAMRVASRVDKKRIKPGTLVRYITNRVGFTKGSAPRWSEAVKPIAQRLGVNTFAVEGVTGTFKDYELQSVPNVPSQTSSLAAAASRSALQKQQTVKNKLARQGLTPAVNDERRLRSGKLRK